MTPSAADAFPGTAPAPARLLSALWNIAWRDRRRTLLALGLMVLAKVCGVLVPLLLKAVIDRFSNPESMSAMSAMSAVGGGAAAGSAVLVLPVFLLLAYALLRFAGTLFTELRDLVFAPVARRAVLHFAQRAFWHLLLLGQRFHAQRSTGALMRDFERGTVGIGFLLGTALFTALPTLVEFLAILGIMAAGYSLWFTFILLLTFVAYAVLTGLLIRRREASQRRVNEIDSLASATLVDSLLNHDTVKAFAREAHELSRYQAVGERWLAGGVLSQRALSTLHIGQSAVIAAGVAAVMLLAGEQTARGVMTVGDLVLVNAYLIQVCLPLNALGFMFRETRDAQINAEKLLVLLQVPPEITEARDAPALALAGGGIAFEHIDFSYEPGRQVLWDLSLTVPPGSTLAVVGGSGSGKSTLARLLMRAYDPQGGRVLIDGQDVRNVRLASLRQAIGLVPQDTALFGQSIAYNIGYGRAGAGLPDIIEAAKAAQVNEFIMSLPQQYDTEVGERGVKLSGGEKQRIAIARAFLKNPPILILDEATSALDTRAERAIQGELDRIARGRTTLVIAHRLSTVVDADQIVVMDKGRIVERGRHQALLGAGGLYAQLWTLQRQQQAVDRLERRLARQPVNLAVLLAHVLDGLRELIAQRRVDIYTEIDGEAASVHGDPSTLNEVIDQLCRWALQGTPAGGRIELRLSRKEGQACLSVVDGRVGDGAGDGHGEAEPLQGPAPDPLALRSAIERQGGRFEMRPPTANAGMCCQLLLPLRAVASPQAHPAPGAADMPLPPKPLAGLSILCVDDNEDALTSLSQLLQIEGAQVQAERSGRAALQALRERAPAQWPQLLVCDIALDEEDGNAVVRQLRQLEAQRGVALAQRMPAVALTGLPQGNERLRALMAGFQALLSKPVAPRELVSLLYLLSGRRAQGAPPQEPGA